MRRVHPLWRGFWLACAYAAALVTLDGTDWLDAYRGNRQSMTLALAVMAGAFLASLPGILRQRGRHSPRPSRKRLLTCFLAGVLMSLACGMAGTGCILPALLEGSTGAYAFAGIAGLTAFVTTRTAERRVRA